MLKRAFYILLIAGFLINSTSCTLLQKSIDKRMGFSNHLKNIEDSIRSEEWEKAKVSLGDSQKAWEKIKPLLQVDIDHDYINSIEEDFVKLGAYIEVKDKSNSLATTLMAEDVWDNIGSL